MKYRRFRFAAFLLCPLAGWVLPWCASAQTAPATAIARDSEHVNAAALTASVPNPNCTLMVPDNPLSAAGLATPYHLVATDAAAGECHESNTSQAAFVQAAILDPSTGTIAIYNPLVVDRGTVPAIAPVRPVLPAGAIVAIWFGYNGSDLTLRPASYGALAAGRCVNGLPGDVFGQFSYCNAPAFFAAARAAVRNGRLTVPPLGTAKDGGQCPSTRSFFVVDQDQSDNLPTMYLVTPDGRTAQFTQANRAALKQATTLGNPSDNRLTDVFVDGALGCHAWTAPDLADPGQQVAALALNELQAQYHANTPVALVPLGDPMALNDGRQSLAKVDLYRIGVDQPLAIAEGDASTARYCRQILRIAPHRLAANHDALDAYVSPDPAAASSLFTFLAQRMMATYDILGCESRVHQTLPVSVETDSSGVAVSAAVDQPALAAVILALEPSKPQDDIADAAWRTR